MKKKNSIHPTHPPTSLKTYTLPLLLLYLSFFFSLSLSLKLSTLNTNTMVEKEDLGLSLSLSLGPDSNHRPNFLNPFFQQKTQWSDLASDEKRPKGIDVNRLPAFEEEEEGDCEEEEAGGCSPDSTVSSVMSGGKRDHHTANINNVVEENDMERAYCSSRGGGGGGGISDEDDVDGSRKKLRLSKDQSAVLEESFKEHNTLNPKQKLALAKQLNLRPRQVEVWFQNRRARTKLKQTEVDCEFLKRCCENMTEENRRLQKEVSELRALKLSPQLYMHMTPPTTLTMCPSCERISSSSSPSSSAAPATHSNHSHHRHNYQHRPMAPTGAPWPPIPLRASFPPMQRS